MAFKGIHFLAAYASRTGSFFDEKLPPLQFLNPSQSETMVKPGVSQIVGAPAHTRYGNTILRVIAAEDSFVTIAADLDTETSITALVLAREPQDFILNPGHKVSWELAK